MRAAVIGICAFVDYCCGRCVVYCRDALDNVDHEIAARRDRGGYYTSVVEISWIEDSFYFFNHDFLHKVIDAAIQSSTCPSITNLLKK